MRIGLILGEALLGLRRNASMVISVILVTFVSLTFVGAAMLMQMQIAKMHDYWVDRAQVAVFLCSSISSGANCTDGVASDDQILAVQEKLDSPALQSVVSDYTFESREEAYQAVLDLYGEDYAEFVTEDQMNEAFRINLVDPTRADVIEEAFRSMAGVDGVQNQMQYLDPLFSALTVATYIAVGIAVLMLIAAVLLIATTIRLSAFARRRELGIMRLVGASNRFIQTPFILEGMFAALIGSALASIAIVAGIQFGVNGYLRDRVDFITSWVGMKDAAVVIPALIVIGLVLAAASAGFAIRRWLRA